MLNSHLCHFYVYNHIEKTEAKHFVALLWCCPRMQIKIISQATLSAIKMPLQKICTR